MASRRRAPVLRLGGALLAAAAAGACLVRGAAAKDDLKYAASWQDDWRSTRHNCEHTKRSLFENAKGKLVSMTLGDLPRKLAQQMLDDKPKNNGLAKKAPPKPKPTGKLSKKDRMKQELLGELTGSLDDVEKRLSEAEKKEEERELKTYEQQVLQMMGQMMQRAKLTYKDDVTLSEFCDLIWRGGNWSPLDADEPVKDADDLREEEEENQDSLASKVEL
mmetsp:Transcript_66262/g.178285  ORF Transcript_66262/g.178285 Transcript_66262/m.178285 type:complete len:219 (-) Transcript_66262:239-895(-)